MRVSARFCRSARWLEPSVLASVYPFMVMCMRRPRFRSGPPLVSPGPVRCSLFPTSGRHVRYARSCAAIRIFPSILKFPWTKRFPCCRLPVWGLRYRCEDMPGSAPQCRSWIASTSVRRFRFVILVDSDPRCRFTVLFLRMGRDHAPPSSSPPCIVPPNWVRRYRCARLGDFRLPSAV